jgi:ABC-type histidine transport system ATPase subunit
MAMLHVENLHVYYGSIHAIKGISFDVEEGEIVTLIGANGAVSLRHSTRWQGCSNRARVRLCSRARALLVSPHIR